MRLSIKRFFSAALFVSIFTAGLLGCAEPFIYEQDHQVVGEFLLGPEDVLEITVWKNQDLSRTTVIRPDGLISMPIIGDVQAAGLSANALAKRIAESLAPFVANPAVSVSVKEINSYSVFVLGEVAKPGKYQLKSYTTLLQAISLAGGFTEFAKRNKLQVLRNSSNGDGRLHEIRIPVRYNDVVAGTGGPGNLLLRSGDTVVVP
jgi:polysaccharide biosynthesis/export protein